MKKLFNNDGFLKIFSVVMAVLCWIFIIFITNPQIEVKISGIPITLSDHQAIKSEGYIVSNAIDATVDIRLSGTRQMLANINKDNVLAYIDLSGCTNKGTYKLPVSIKLPYEEVKVVSKSIYNMTIAVDNYISRDFDVEYTYTGELKNQNYMIYSTTLNSDKVTVSGPEDIIKTIEKAVINIEVNKESGDFSGLSEIQFLNSNNADIKSDMLESDLKEISYRCTVYEKKSVEVAPYTENQSSNVKFTVKDHPKVTVLGPSADIDKITSVSTDSINYNADKLPETVRVGLSVPKGIEIEEDITYVNVLVENK